MITLADLKQACEELGARAALYVSTAVRACNDPTRRTRAGETLTDEELQEIIDEASSTGDGISKADFIRVGKERDASEREWRETSGA